jgi:hypothetical protein
VKGFTIGFGDHAQRQEGVILSVECLQQFTTDSVPVKTQVPDIGIDGKLCRCLHNHK